MKQLLFFILVIGSLHLSAAVKQQTILLDDCIKKYQIALERYNPLYEQLFTPTIVHNSVTTNNYSYREGKYLTGNCLRGIEKIIPATEVNKKIFNSIVASNQIALTVHELFICYLLGHFAIATTTERLNKISKLPVIKELAQHYQQQQDLLPVLYNYLTQKATTAKNHEPVHDNALLNGSFRTYRFIKEATPTTSAAELARITSLEEAPNSFMSSHSLPPLRDDIRAYQKLLTVYNPLYALLTPHELNDTIMTQPPHITQYVAEQCILPIAKMARLDSIINIKETLAATSPTQITVCSADNLQLKYIQSVRTAIEKTYSKKPSL